MQRSSQQTCIGADNETGIVWHVACQAISCGLEVALMASQVHQSHHLGRPCYVLSGGVAAEHLIVQDVALAVQLHRTNMSGKQSSDGLVPWDEQQSPLTP